MSPANKILNALAIKSLVIDASGARKIARQIPTDYIGNMLFGSSRCPTNVSCNEFIKRHTISIQCIIGRFNLGRGGSDIQETKRGRRRGRSRLRRFYFTGPFEQSV